MSDITLELLRVASTNYGTFGVLKYKGRPFALTLEKPWQDNTPHTSSIPAGQYVCKRVPSPKFGNTFEVLNVPNRSHILFHRGNTIADTEGCILIGEAFSGTSITQSSVGFAEFHDILRGQDTFNLIIKTVG